MVSPISEGQELYCEFTKQGRQEKIMYMYSQMFCFKHAEDTCTVLADLSSINLKLYAFILCEHY